MFKPQFAPLVKSGKKRQTIRPVPKRMPKVGELESWRKWRARPYRSKTVKLATVELTDVLRLTIRRDGIRIQMGKLSCHFREGDSMGDALLRTFARNDGFKDWPVMREYFAREHRLPWRCIGIKGVDAK